MELKKINVLSLSKISLLFGILLGLIAGISLPVSLRTSPELAALPQMAIAVKLGYWSILAYPIIYAVISFISAAITALLYNLFAKFVGGIKWDLQK